MTYNTGSQLVGVWTPDYPDKTKKNEWMAKLTQPTNNFETNQVSKPVIFIEIKEENPLVWKFGSLSGESNMSHAVKNVNSMNGNTQGIARYKKQSEDTMMFKYPADIKIRYLDAGTMEVIWKWGTNQPFTTIWKKTKAKKRNRFMCF